MEIKNRPEIKPLAMVLRDIIKNEKRHIFITGSKGIGKSTLLKAALGEITRGLLSFAVWNESTVHPDCVRMVNAESKEEAVIGKYENGRMQAVRVGFDLGIKAVEAYDGEGPFVIDEVGFLEENAKEYHNALLKLLDRKRVIAVLRKQDTKFITLLKSRQDAFLIDLDLWYENFEKQKVALVILASGFSKRFEGNKLLAEYEGTPLISCLFKSIPKEAFSDVITVTRYKEIKELSEKENLKALLHSELLLSDTIRLGVGSIENADGYMLSVSDQPLISRETFLTLLLKFALYRDKLIRPVSDNKPGNPVIFPAKYREELMSIEGDVGGKAVIKKHPEEVITQEILNNKEFFDIDTRENLEELNKI